MNTNQEAQMATFLRAVVSHLEPVALGSDRTYRHVSAICEVELKSEASGMNAVVNQPLSIPATRVKAFRKSLNGLRWGQEFYGFMELHKLTSPAAKAWCDKLYNADDETAKKMVESVTDHAN